MTQTRNPDQNGNLWHLLTDDRRDAGGARAGLAEGCTLSCYLRLVDRTSRLLRAGKAQVEASVASVFERLGIQAEWREATVPQLLRAEKRTGTHFGPRARLAEAAAIHGHRWHRDALPQA